MADEAPSSEEKTISFSVKSSSDQKYNLTVPESMTVLDLKTKLSTSEYADIPPERQRLIYSGRVLKDPDTLSTYKIKDGNTVHMVKGAASSQRQNPASQGSGAASSTAQSNPAAAGVPQNLATGTGNDPLAGLTGARYAGFAQMPNADMFGADGGMGPPPGPEDMLNMLENPMFASQMNEAMNNPDVIRMMTNNPMVQQNPFLRQALQNPEFRRMMMDPNVIRSSMQMSRMMGGGGPGGQNAMPAPGVTDTTPQQAGTGGNTGSTTQTNTTQNLTSPPAFNPFQMMGQQGAGNQNPFAALFGGGMGFPAAANTSTTSSQTTTSTSNTQDTQNNQPQQQQPPNPFAAMMPQMPADGQQQNPFGTMMQQMMQNPAMLQQAMSDLQGMGMGSGGNQNSATGGTNNPQDQQGAAGGFNPFAMFGQGGAGFGAPPTQQDSRPPEEMYSEQLRQLNEMGFYEFERNVRALRMAGGSVQGAIEMLLGGSV